METAVISGLERYKNNTVTLLTLTQAMLRDLGCETIDVDGLSAITRRIEGTLIGITMRETADGMIKVSLRSLDDRFDVSEIAAAFGGGGHKRASGCVFNEPLSDAKEKLLQKTFEVWDSCYDNSGQ